MGLVFHSCSQSHLAQPWAGKSLGTSDYLKIVSWVWKEVFPSHFREREHVSPETGKLYDVWMCVSERGRQTGKREKEEKHILAFKGQLLSVSATGVKFLWPLVRWTSFNHVFQIKALSDFPPDFCRNDLNTGRPERTLSRNYGDDLVIWVSLLWGSLRVWVPTKHSRLQGLQDCHDLAQNADAPSPGTSLWFRVCINCDSGSSIQAR